MLNELELTGEQLIKFVFTCLIQGAVFTCLIQGAVGILLSSKKNDHGASLISPYAGSGEIMRTNRAVRSFSEVQPAGTGGQLEHRVEPLR